MERERERERERMNDSFWSQMDAVVAETLNDHKFMDKIEPPRTVKKIMNVVKRHVRYEIVVLEEFFIPITSSGTG